MLKNLIIVVATVSVTLAAHAGPGLARAAAKEVHEMKDGSTIYVFRDEKMALENRWGRAELIKAGAILETKSGQILVQNGNEVARLSSLLRSGNGN